eukprot:CAMPEP_0176438062 /NCGR_PEP_ID=MMETSP0127-20121128/19042_1 /TAXON_ID=938130 /ORGANISM="Platyophrya macrostoma, Strain WH" /LENGTH=402 /DNA_ID=CAMNT_0017821905 /DNA_START=43 /DNA_END=1251 /DNA_ORIENTATION=+
MSKDILESVLALRPTCDTEPLAVLNVAPGLPPITMETPISEARRNYMRLAAMIHPDKFTGRPALVAEATDAFQLLVRAFEKIASPAFRSVVVSKPCVAAQSAGARGRPQRRRLEQEPVATRRTRRVSSEDEDTNSDSESSSSSGNEKENDAVVVSKKSLSLRGRTGKEVLVRPQRQSLSTTVEDKRTVVKCPRCVTCWQPDEPRQYSLFMGYGLKVHCQLCLFVFGCATAVHGCPHCGKPFDYDISMYDDAIRCVSCKKSFRCPYYPVLAEMVDTIRNAEASEAATQQQHSERAERAAARHRNDDDDQKMLELIGKCVVEEECPLCNKRVTRGHRSHVEACAKSPSTAKKPRQVKTFVVEEKKNRRARGASSSKQSTKDVKPKRTQPSKSKRGGRNNSDSDA